jgi:excisionase family DNA binding protein
MPEKILVSKKDAAAMLSISVRSIEKLIRRRQLEVRKIGRRTLISVSSVESFAKSDGVSVGAVHGLN